MLTGSDDTVVVELAAVYPLSMFLRVIIAQIFLLILL